MATRPFVLLDRDGTLNVDVDFLSDPAQLELIPGVVEALRRLDALGCGLVVVTNQSGVARRLISPAALDAVHARLREMLAPHGIQIAGIYTCPHRAEDNCACRKPRTALVEQAARECGFDPRACFMIGDKVSDVELGLNVGAVSLLVRTGYGAATALNPQVKANYIVDDLPAAADVIEQLLIARHSS